MEWNKEIGIHLMVGFRGLAFEDELKAIMESFHVGGIVLFRRNIESRGQLLDLLQQAQAFARENLGRPIWVAVDQEGGPVQRLAPPFTRLPAARDLAREGPGAIVAWAEKAAKDLREIGIRINFAPVLDVLPQVESHFMKERCLGSDPYKVAELGRIWIETLQLHGISATAKHFPGLGRAELDPHYFFPVIHWMNEEEGNRDLHPFTIAVQAGVHCVMSSHALYVALDDVWPATLSVEINRRLLRERLNFRGVLVSDDLDMAAIRDNFSMDEIARQGLESTIDLFLLCQKPERIGAFYRALYDRVSGSHFAKELHQRSMSRIGRLFGLHEARLCGL